MYVTFSNNAKDMKGLDESTLDEITQELSSGNLPSRVVATFLTSDLASKCKALLNEKGYVVTTSESQFIKIKANLPS